jgi:hypothetical protein
MKRCPKCDRSFADFHHVCDFDGTDLVDDPRTFPVFPVVSARAAATKSPFLRLVKSPVFLTVLLLAGLLSSLLLIVYYGARQPNSIAESRAPRDSPDSPNSIVSQAPPAQPPARIGTAPSTKPNEVSTESGPGSPCGQPAWGGGCDRVTHRSEISKTKAASRSRPRLRTSPSIRNQQSRPEIALQRQPKDKSLQKESKESALQRDSKENPNRKESKLTAALKTTWNILKKPFKF